MAESADPSPVNKKPSQSDGYLKYGGLAIQLLAILGVCGWVGHKLDRWLSLKYPIFMLILGFLGFGAILFQIYRTVNRD
jgi:F0F1-type ATP synthase assembly protein I